MKQIATEICLAVLTAAPAFSQQSVGIIRSNSHISQADS